MTKLVITHTLEIDSGSIPDHALAEYLKRAEDDESDWNIWEIAQHSPDGTCRLVSVEVADKK